MFSRACAVAVTTVAIAAALVWVQVAAGGRAERRSHAVVSGLRHGIAWHRSMTWRFQDQAGIARTPTRYVERRARSIPFLRWVDRLWSGRRIAARRHYLAVARSTGGSVPAIICSVFGAARCPEAKAIARRESGFSTNPQPPNPTHFGIFQLDASAIAAYARGRYSTALDQVRAAFRMYLARGWEPWTCCEG
jgi:hypothetical protein